MAEAVLAGTALLKGASTILGANSQANDLRDQAGQLDAQAGTTRASGQRQAIEEQRQARLASSRGLAVAAASGGGADDPTVVNLLANIAGEGEYRSATDLYTANEQAFSLESQADARRKEAKNVKRAAWIKAAGSILGAGSSLQDRFG